MPEVKNAFIKSKMNKDLDARLVPSGEYRNAVNIQISKSEGADVGAVENIKGNNLIQNLNTVESVSGLDVIGYYSDEANNCLYIFSTNQNVNLSQNLGNNAKCFIHKYDFNGQGTLTKLVEGSFLNFDKNSYITGVHLLEELLFFTDNRNQPRVINISKQLGYYTTEDHISVAKFAPVKPISIIESYEDAVTSIFSANTFEISGGGDNFVKIGDNIISNNLFVGKVQSFSALFNRIVVDRNISIVQNDPVIFKRSTMVNKTQEHLDDYNKVTGTVDNPNYDPTWEGDSDFLEDKFVRFSYRFKFDDNQYSILAPFTQPIFIPKQFGYFLGDDEEQTYKTSVVNFFENFIQEVILKVPLASSNIIDDFKIKEIDIVYKESDALSVKVMSSISSQTIIDGQISTDEGYFYDFNYTSKKPYKTLPESEIVRVYDKVPVKSQSQEIISNRVVYGNYVDKNSPPALLPNYYITSGTKQFKDKSASEYPSHTLKQNRTYQVGIVLSDRYGRSTSVLLSSRDSNLGGQGSSIFHKFNSSLNVEDWNGDVMQFILDEPISESVDESINYPGLYASSDNGNKSWDIDAATVTRVAPGVYSINVNITSFVSIGDYLRGKNKDYVKVTNVTWNGNITTVECDGDFNDTYITPDGNPGIADKRFAYTINNLGWYSYKIVVKQTEQDYYNVYLPLVINGEYGAANTGGDIDSLAQAVLINDNINKVPRDLSEVGPDQKQYGSSVRLFGRVAPQRGNTDTNNEQWYPNISSDQVAKIATAQDSGYDTAAVIAGMYKSESNPLIATISSLAPSASTETFGRLPNVGSGAAQNLSIYETNPTISLLDIFWESSTSGLISDLNSEALNSYSGIVGIDNSSYSFSFDESQQAGTGGPPPLDVTGDFRFINTNGPIPSSGANNPVVTATLVSCTDGNSNPLNVTSGSSSREFELVSGALANTFKLRATKSRVFLSDANARKFTFTYNVTYEDSSTSQVSSTITSTGQLTNIQPTLTATTINHSFAQSDTTLFNLSSYIDNGTALSSSENLELVYNKISESNPSSGSSNFITVNPATGLVSKGSGSVPTPITLVVNADDANNGVGSLTSPSQTHVISFGPTPVNFTTPSSVSIPCDPTYNPVYTATYLSSSISNPLANNYPSAFNNHDVVCNLPSFGPNCHQSQLVGSIQGLTAGTARFTFRINSGFGCGSNFGQLQLQCWVYYKAFSGTTWNIATPSSGGQALNGTTIYLTAGSGTTSIFRDYNTVGEYRLMTIFTGVSCSSCSSYNNASITITDANYP
jgi:hypothetical protein